MLLLLIVTAISLDSLLIAFAYGLKRLALPFTETVKIALTVGIVFGMSMIMGNALTSFISVDSAEILGGAVLAAVGIFLLLSVWVEKSKKKQDMPFIIQILKKPLKADLDKSWSINGMEAILIGMALSLDSIGAGIGVSILGISPVLATIVVILITAVFLMTGVQLGRTFANIKGIEKVSFLPGCLLLIIGLWKIIW